MSNILHLLSALDSVPHAEPVLASLVVISKIFSKFLSSAIFSLIVVLQVCPPEQEHGDYIHLLLYLV